MITFTRIVNELLSRGWLPLDAIQAALRAEEEGLTAAAVQACGTYPMGPWAHGAMKLLTAVLVTLAASAAYAQPSGPNTRVVPPLYYTNSGSIALGLGPGLALSGTNLITTGGGGTSFSATGGLTLSGSVLTTIVGPQLLNTNGILNLGSSATIANYLGLSSYQPVGNYVQYNVSGTGSIATLGSGSFGSLFVTGSSSLDNGAMKTDGQGNISSQSITVDPGMIFKGPVSGFSQLSESATGSVLTYTGSGGFVVNSSLSVTGALTMSNSSLVTNLNSQYLNGLPSSSYQPAGSYLISVSANAPITGNGTGGNPLLMTVANSAANGYLTSADWTTFNGKQGAGNYITALSGNVVANGPGSVSATIQPGVVTLAMMANESATTILGNSTTASATPQALTAGEVQTFLGLQSAAYTPSSSYPSASAFNNLANNVIQSCVLNPPIYGFSSGTLQNFNLSYSPAFQITNGSLDIASGYAQYNFGANSFSGSGNIVLLAGGTLGVFQGNTTSNGIVFAAYDSNTTFPTISAHYGGQSQYLVMIGGIYAFDAPDGNVTGALLISSSDGSNTSFISGGIGGWGNPTGPDLWFQPQSGANYFQTRIIIGGFPDDGTTPLQVNTGSPSSVGFRITAQPGQTGNLAQWEGSGGSANIVLAIGPSGVAPSSLVITNSASQFAPATIGPGLVFTNGTLQTTSTGSIATSGSGSFGSLAVGGSAIYSPVSFNITGQTAAVSSIGTATAPNDGNSHTYSVGGYLTVTAVATNTITLQTTYTDENNNSQTLSFYGMGTTVAALSATGASNFPPMTIRVKANATITVKTTTTGIGTQTYDTGCYIQRIQ
jgi:hypothetical protein